MAEKETWFHRIRKKIPPEGNRQTIITPYESYGTPTHVYSRGRVLADNRIQPSDSKNVFRMLSNTYKRFNTYEKPNVPVIIQVNQTQYEEITNQEGFFKLKVQCPPINVNESVINWVPIQTWLQNAPEISGQTKMMIPSPEAEYGVISDIDDTVIHTGVSSFLKWRLVYNSFLKHVKGRKPLIGAPSFYRALQKGGTKKKINPFFYISNSPWNLYDYLRLFLKTHSFPKGPLILRDLAFPGTKQYKNEKNHKQSEIINIFETYPDMKFILIGDSAEHDATIYSDVAKEFPERVLCIYLHTISRKKQMEYVESVVHESKHVEMLLVNSARDAAIHAKERGFITPKQFKKIDHKLSNAG